MRRSSVISPSRDRDVEVGAEQDPATVDVAEVLELGNAHRWAARSLVGRADDLHQVDEAVRVAPLVVVPAEHLDQVAHGHGEARVERARRRRADDVGRHQRIVAVDEHVGQRAARRPRPGRPR